MSCFFPSGYKVTFDGDDLGEEIIEYLSSWSWATPTNIRHNFWSYTPTIDATFPAKLWEHNFLIYNEEVNRGQYAKAFFEMQETCVSSRPRQLYILNKETDEEILALGYCTFDAGEQDTPKQLFFVEAGLIRMKFLGTSAPSLVSSY